MVHTSISRYASYIGADEQFYIQLNNSTSQGLPYDFESIMHFHDTAFTRKYFQSTIVPLNPIKIQPHTLGSSEHPTAFDYLHINLLYCKGTIMIINTKDDKYMFQYSKNESILQSSLWCV